MNSINNTIERLTRRGTLSGMLGAYLYAAFLVAGPWIFTVFGLLSLGPADCEGSCAELTVFRSIVIYNSMYTLIVSSPLAFVSGRYASEQTQEGERENVFSAFLLSIGLFALLSIATVGPFYVFAATLDPAATAASLYNVMLIGCSWLLIPILGAIRAYNSVLLAFGVGAASMTVFGGLLHDPSAATLLTAFNCSFAITDLILLAAVTRSFGAEIAFDPEITARVRKNWELPAAGAAYAMGLWIDKIIMWHADASGRLLVAGALWTRPSYDSAMFWAQLSSIPIIAVFFVHVETDFFLLRRLYHTRMQQQASLRELNQIVTRIGAHVVSSVFGLFLALIVTAGTMMMASFLFMGELGLRPSYMGIFRVSLCAMIFYIIAMFCFSFLLHLDLRRPALLIVSSFLFFNATLTLILLPLGPDFFGYGNMIAAAITLVIAFKLVSSELSWLHYHAFITNNSSS